MKGLGYEQVLAIWRQFVEPQTMPVRQISGDHKKIQLESFDKTNISGVANVEYRNSRAMRVGDIDNGSPDNYVILHDINFATTQQRMQLNVQTDRANNKSFFVRWNK